MRVLMGMPDRESLGGPAACEPPFVAELRRLGVEVEEETYVYGERAGGTSFGERIRRVLVAARRLRRRVEGGRFDVLHLNTSFDARALLRDVVTTSLLPRRGGTRLFLKFHGSDAALLRTSNPLLRLCARRLLARADGVGVLSSEERENFARAGVPQEKIFVVKNVVERARDVRADDAGGDDATSDAVRGDTMNDATRDDTTSHAGRGDVSNDATQRGVSDGSTPVDVSGESARRREALAARHGFEAGVPVLLFIARFIPAKGLLDVIRACRVLRERGCEVALLCVGDGPARAEAEEEARRLDLSERVRFCGYVPEAETREFYEGSTMLVFPTYHYEGFPMVVFYSLAAGLPVVTTRIRAAADYLAEPDNCLWVGPRDPEALADKIEFLIAHTEVRDAMSENNRGLARCFTAAAVAPEYVEAYRRIAASRV